MGTPKWLVLMVLMAFAAPLFAEPLDPAKEAEKESTKPSEPEKASSTAWHSWEAPALKVPGAKSELREEDRIGKYKQPRWAAHRRFERTRVYVRPEGQIDAEIWNINQVPRRTADADERVENEWQFEVEFGLPYRFQFDAYLVFAKTGQLGALEVAEEKFELRWALLDWGVIYTNPTLYLEYAVSNGGPDGIEGKILLGDEIIPRLHWGANLVVEHKLGEDHNNEFALTLAISYTIIDSVFSVGWEHQSSIEDSAEDRGTYEDQHLTGPSVQFRPSPQSHVNIVPFFGIGGHSPVFKLYITFGWEF